MESKSKKIKVAFRVTSCAQEDGKLAYKATIGNRTQIRETIEKSIKDELVSISGVEIIDNDIQNAWNYFIQIVFNYTYRQLSTKDCRYPDKSQELIVSRISICLYENGIPVASYNPITSLSQDQLCEFCKDWVKLFNLQYIVSDHV